MWLVAYTISVFFFFFFFQLYSLGQHDLRHFSDGLEILSIIFLKNYYLKFQNIFIFHLHYKKE